jgi:hypothetical protein
VRTARQYQVSSDGALIVAKVGHRKVPFLGAIKGAGMSDTWNVHKVCKDAEYVLLVNPHDGNFVWSMVATPETAEYAEVFRLAGGYDKYVVSTMEVRTGPNYESFQTQFEVEVAGITPFVADTLVEGMAQLAGMIRNKV